MPDKSEINTERAQLVRLYEANAGIDYPSADDLNFRLAVAKKLGLAFSLREVRPLVIAGPVTQAPPRPGPAAPAASRKS